MSIPACLTDADVCWWPMVRLPDGFQQLLVDYLDELNESDLQLHAVPSRIKPLSPEYASQLKRDVALWEPYDFEKMRSYVADMTAGDIFPPLIIAGDELHDGYHRGAALLELERKHFEAIELHELAELQRYCRDAGDPAGHSIIRLPEELVRRDPWRTARSRDLLVG